ncbi:MAG TPA: chemotaxis response regulator protein-glutamate methylesterase [Firmicutes bacterium]|nr:chemotaxis response regulator protein-glutamate methylesterase [Bacillota bacterium]
MPIKVLVVDDSAFMRKLISEIINAEADLEAVATARNGQDALNKLARLDIDVVTLDVEMPVMDGLEALRHIMSTKPLPVVMLSSMTKKGSDTTMQALALGAVDFIPKPSGSISLDLKDIAALIVEKVRLAAKAQVREIKKTSPLPRAVRPKVFPPAAAGAAEKLVIIGSSTGGPRAVEEVFGQLPRNLPAGILVVQHMPAHFTRSFAERLDALFSFPVKEAADGDLIENSKVLIAPGDFHLLVGQDRRVHLNQSDKVMFLRPAIDVTMASLISVYGSKILGVILTGMGRDGAQGMAKIKAAGGITIAQDQNSSTIYSMPRAAAEEGNADYILPLNRIGEAISKIVPIM